MPFRIFRAYDERMRVQLIQRQNARARAEWNARLAEMKRREGRGF